VIARRIVSIVVFIVILVVATAIARPAWATSVGLDVWSLPELREQIAASADRDRDLEAEDSEVCRRIEAKEQLIRELISGQITLEAATTQFTLFDLDSPEHLSVIRRIHPGATDSESMARNVAAYASMRLEDEPVLRRLQVLARLHVELSALCEIPAPRRKN